jgi:hypothetical protein
MKSCAARSTVGACPQLPAMRFHNRTLMANPIPLPCGLVVKNAEKI